MRIILLFLFASATADSLYDASDPILELDVDSFGPAVYGSKKAHFVEFYSSWCGACIGYAPTFKKFARELASWAPIVQVTVVNCADDKNMPLCREQQINAFPTLKYFKYDSKDKNDGLLYQGNKHDLPALELDVAGLVQSDWNQQKPTGWPSFLPIENTASLQDIWDQSGSVQLLGFAVQENPATMAWATMINFNNDHRVRVVLARPQHPEVTKHLGSNANNRFILLSRGNPVPIWTSSEDAKWIDVQEKVNEKITELLGAGVAPAPVRVEPILQESQGVAPDAAHAVVDLTQYKVQLVDLQSTYGYMLYKEVPRREIINGDDLAGLKQWTQTLKKYAPGTTPVRRLFYRLDEWLQLQNSVTADGWTAKVDEIQISLGNPLPKDAKDIRYIACAGSKSNLRGYTCGLWTLLHAMSVEAYKLEKNNVSFRPVIDVLEPFRQFITRFLSCQECAQNFQKETENHQLHLVTRKEDVVMWPWRVHNFVNKRLSGSPSDDPKFPKRQFPPKAICVQCFDSNGNYDETKVFEFLQNYYLDIKQDEAKPAPGYKVTDYKDGKLQAAASRHLNPKFAVHADKVDKLEEAEAMLRKDFNADPVRSWKDIENYENSSSSGSGSYYIYWLVLIAVFAFIAYCRYRRHRSKFWKTFYYNSDFKLCPWMSDRPQKQYTA